MRFLLDTDTCSYIIKKYPAVLQRFQRYKRSQLAMSAVTCAELYYGAMRKVEKKYEQAVDIFRQYVPVLDWPADAVRHYGVIRAQLEAKGQLIGELDMMIAAHALTLKAILVTNNQKHFQRVPGLKLENWMS